MDLDQKKLLNNWLISVYTLCGLLQGWSKVSIYYTQALLNDMKR